MSGCVSKSLYSALKARDASRYAARNAVKLVKLNKDGTPSKMHDATTHCASTEEAETIAARIRALNPGRPIRYAIDGNEI